MQVNVSLTDECARLLRERADEKDLAPTTLAGDLLEKALRGRATGVGEGAPDRPSAKPLVGDETRQLLEDLRTEVARLSRAQHNATLKILRQGGMSVEEVREWAKRHLK